MNNKSIGFLATIIVIGFTTACSKQVEQSAVEKELAGTWQWVSTDGGLAGHIHETPASTGKNVSLKITTDGKYSIITNGVSTSEGTYVLEKGKCIHDHTNKTVINFSSSAINDLMIEKVDSTKLKLTDENYDGTETLYERAASSGH